MYSKFGVLNKEKLHLKNVDRDGDLIANEDLLNMVCQFKVDYNFYIELIFDGGVITSHSAQVCISKVDCIVFTSNIFHLQFRCSKNIWKRTSVNI